MQYLILLFAAAFIGCSSGGGENNNVHTPGRADTLQLKTDSAAGSRVDGTAVEGTGTDTLAP